MFSYGESLQICLDGKNHYLDGSYTHRQGDIFCTILVTLNHYDRRFVEDISCQITYFVIEYVNCHDEDNGSDFIDKEIREAITDMINEENYDEYFNSVFVCIGKENQLYFFHIGNGLILIDEGNEKKYVSNSVIEDGSDVKLYYWSPGCLEAMKTITSDLKKAVECRNIDEMMGELAELGIVNNDISIERITV